MKKPIYFNWSEFDSPDIGSGGEANMQIQTVGMIDRARQLYGKPMHIDSGYRTPAHNAAVGGVTGSSHVEGWAVDIACERADYLTMVAVLYAVGFRRFGLMNGAIHVDCDPKKVDARWDYPDTPQWVKDALPSLRSIQTAFFTWLQKQS
jgi:hypothetical protein